MKITKENVDPNVFRLYDDYAHNRLNRRSFVEKLSFYAVGGMTVPALLAFLSPNYQDYLQIKPDDSRIITRKISYDSPNGGGRISGLLCLPKKQPGKLGSVLVVHENRGLNPYIEDVARRAAVAGFMSLAPDALSPLGGYPGNDDDGRALQSERNRDEMLEDFISGFEFLHQHAQSNQKVGVVGFCFGGWISNMMAARVPQLSAAVPFYGGQADLELVPQIQAPLQLHYAETDERVNAGWPEYEKALKLHNKEYEAYFYPNTQHGFHNDSTPRFDKKAADLAWQRTLRFFEQHLA